MAPLWVKIDVGIQRHPKLSGRAPWERCLWLGLICVAKEHFPSSGVIRNLGPADFNREFNLQVTAKEVAATLHYFANEGLVLLSKDGSISIKDFLRWNPQDPTNAERQARYRARHNAKVTNGVTHGPLPEGEGDLDLEEDLSKNRGGDHEASRRVAKNPSPSSSSSRSPSEIQALGVDQLEEEWPTATLAQLQAVAKKVYEPHKKPAAWVKFLRAAAPFDEAVRVAAARKYLERDAKSGKNLDYLAAIIRSMAKERVVGENGSDGRRAEDQDPKLTVAATLERIERQKRETDELLKLSPEERRAMMQRGLQAGRAKPNGQGNGIQEVAEPPRAPLGHKA